MCRSNLKEKNKSRICDKFNNVYKAENKLKDNVVLARAKITNFRLINLLNKKPLRKTYVLDQGSY